MRKRSTIVVSLLVAAATALAATAAMAGAPANSPNGNAQSVEALISPKKLSKSTWTPASLKVTTKLRNSTAPNGVPVPTVRVLINFTKSINIFNKGVPTCEASKLQNVSTEIARRECKAAQIGTGKATALIPVGEKVFTVNPIVTAFNGKPKGGKPVILLHTYAQTPIVVTTVLTGVVTNTSKGPKLDVEVPKLAGGAGALTDFQVTINKKFRYRGKAQSYISAKCPNNKKLSIKSTFTFLDGQSSKPVDSKACTQKK